MGVGPIPWTAIESYCGYLGLDLEEREDMHANVRALDDEYLSWHAKRAKGGQHGKP